MTVTSILAAKGRNVESIEPTATLTNAVKRLTEKKIGALIVRGPGGRLAGIISERDIVRALAARGASALDEPVGQSMTREVVTCGVNDEVASLMERMTRGKFRHMPVITKDELAGVISIGDVVKDRLQAMEQETEAMRDYIRSA
ncbi:MAG: CBS domain-containing protein [Pseudolabrys sp.]|nr:CBS domain-containing protein [Pseudolabrys sp.]